jgi:tRNA nucleotidyltransferase (CCA-adding enzyme)
LQKNHTKKSFEDLFDLPNNIKEILLFLKKNGFYPIVVGGFVRDKLLHMENIKDIDIEVYNAPSYERLTTVLSHFGTINQVGKSFATLKLQTDTLECDFSLPRKETKVAKGHKGFHVHVDTNLDFNEAAKRRDFTINAMGLDIFKKKLLDPFGGYEDLHNKILKHVDTKSFTQDPLRILRGVVFAARFQLQVAHETKKLFTTMILHKQLLELPKERIFEELKKLFYKAKKPSTAFILLYECKEDFYFKKLFTLKKELLLHTYQTLDNLALANTKDLALFMSALSLHVEKPIDFVMQFTHDKKLLKEVANILKYHTKFLEMIDTQEVDDFTLKLLATKTNINKLLTFLEATTSKKKDLFQTLRNRAKELGVLHSPLAPLVTGKDLIALGLHPSKEFQKILSSIYIDQLKGLNIDTAYLQKKLNLL